MNTVCEKNKCVGCMNCAEVCPAGAIHIEDTLDAYNAVIDAAKCCDCNLCRNLCQNNRTVELTKPRFWFQGYANDENIRAKSSSGGAAAALMRAFTEQGGIVCACMFDKGSFGFGFADTAGDVEKFVGSKYVKSNPLGVYKKIKSMLQNGKQVLFIGLPCQAAAVKYYVGQQLGDRLYTVDLICHGSPTPKLLERFLTEHGLSLDKAEDIGFRIKNKFNLSYNLGNVVPNKTRDTYTMAFLNGLDYTENCYSCQYAQFNRVGDITLGDSWGSELAAEEKRKGLSLILCQNEKGRDLVQSANLRLMEVDIKRAREANHQLNYPSPVPKSREKFFTALSAGKSFDKAVSGCLPKEYYKEIARKWMYRLKLR